MQASVGFRARRRGVARYARPEGRRTLHSSNAIKWRTSPDVPCRHSWRHIFEQRALVRSNDKDRRTERGAAEEPATPTPPLANSQPPHPPEAEVRPSAQRRVQFLKSAQTHPNPPSSTPSPKSALVGIAGSSGVWMASIKTALFQRIIATGPGTLLRALAVGPRLLHE